MIDAEPATPELPPTEPVTQMPTTLAWTEGGGWLDVTHESVNYSFRKLMISHVIMGPNATSEGGKDLSIWCAGAETKLMNVTADSGSTLSGRLRG